MKRSILFSLIFLCTSGIATAQIDWFGYLESEMDHYSMNNQNYTFGYLKTRLDMESRPTDKVLVAANVNIQQYMGRKTWNLLDFLPNDIWQPYYSILYSPDSLANVKAPFTYRDTLYLDNAYLRVNFKYLDLTVGKQPISLGTGYAWNPVDVFNYKDPVDPTYEQTGIQAFRVDIPLTDRGGLALLLTPAEDWNSATKYLQLKSGLGSFDFTLNWSQYTATYRWWDYYVYAGSIPTTSQYHSFGGTAVGQFFGMGIWAEGWHKHRTAFGGKSTWESVVGADYTFTNGWYILNEYYFNGQGATESNLQFNDYMEYFEGHTHSLMQNYDFFYTFYPVGDFVNLGVFALANLDDNSAMISPQIEWNVFENGTLTFWYSFPYGKSDTEFGYQGDGWRIRLRTYF